MKFTALATTMGLSLLLGMSAAQASPHPHHSHKRVVVAHKVVVKPAPLRTAISGVASVVRHTLPADHVRLVHSGRTYYVHDGIYYVKEPHGYVVVQAVAGIRLTSLPRGYTSYRVGGETRYRFNNVHYRKAGSVYIVV